MYNSSNDITSHHSVSGAILTVTTLISLFLGDRYHERLLFAVGFFLLVLLGTLLMVCLPSSMNAGKLIGYYFTQASAPAAITVYSLIST